MQNGNVESILEWFKRAVPTPNDKNRTVQMGVHVEEFAEMLESLGVCKFERSVLEDLSIDLKGGNLIMDDLVIAREELLDSLCDQIVTAVGVAHMFGMDIAGALAEVDRSNWSKFDAAGQPTFDDNGKIAKNPLTYRKPELAQFV